MREPFREARIKIEYHRRLFFCMSTTLDCPICYEEITKASGRTETSCGHTFHPKCIYTWYTKDTRCPCCRKEAAETEIPTKQEAVIDNNPFDMLLLSNNLYNITYNRIRPVTLDIFIEHVRDLLINANIPIIHDTHGYNQNIIP